MPFYDWFAGHNVTQLGLWLMQQSAEHALQLVEAAVAPLHSIVEIGPGHGAFARAAREKGYLYSAVDANVQLLKNLDRTPGVASFVPPIPIQDGACDAVVAMHVLEHAPTFTHAQAMLADMRRIVRPGGCVAVVSPDLLWVKNYYWDADYSHNFPTSARRLHQMFLDQDLEIAHLGYVHNHLEGWKGAVAGRAVRLIPYHLFEAPPTSRLYSDQIYRNRLTFSRSVAAIGRRPLDRASA